MPLYDYCCKNLDCPVELFEAYTHISEGPIAKCPHCKELTQERLISGGTYLAIKGMQTLGSIADKNRNKMGQYLYDKKMKEKEERAIQASNYVGKTAGTPRERKVGDKDYIPPWRESKKIDTDLSRLGGSLDNSKNDAKIAEERHRYIMTGKKGQGSGPPTI